MGCYGWLYLNERCPQTPNPQGFDSKNDHLYFPSQA